MKKFLITIAIILSVIIGTIICLYYYQNNPNNYIVSRKLKTIELPESDFNIEVYYLEGLRGFGGGGAYNVGNLEVYKTYKDGGYENIYSAENRGISYDFKKVGNNKMLLLLKFKKEEYYNIIDTLSSGLVIDSGGFRTIGYKYDTVRIDLK